MDPKKAKITNVEKFITKLSDHSIEHLQELQKFYSQICEEKNQFQLHQESLLNEIFKLDSQLQFLINLWLEHRSKKQFTQTDHLLLDLFVTIIDQLNEYWLVGKDLELDMESSWSLKKFLIHFMEQLDTTIIYYLNSKSFFLQLNSLKVLVKVADTQVCGKQVLNLLEGLHKESIKNMLLNEPLHLRGDISLSESEVEVQKLNLKRELRDTFYSLFFKVVDTTNYSIIQQSLGSNTFNKLFDQLVTDPFTTLKRLVDVLEPMVVVDSFKKHKVHPKTWTKFFNREFLVKAVELLTVKDKEQTNDVEGGNSNSRSKLIYKFLLQLTTLNNLGLAYVNPNQFNIDSTTTNLAVDSKVNSYQPLVELIQLLKPSNYLIHRQLLLQMLRSNLYLIPHLFTKAPLNLDPSLTNLWVSNVTLLNQTLSFKVIDWSFLLHRSMTIDEIMNYILPAKFIKSYQLKGLQFKGLVTYFTLQALLASLNRFQIISEFLTTSSDLHDLELVDRLGYEFKRRFIDFSALQPLLNEVLNCTTTNGSSSNQLKSMKRVVLKLSLQYQRVLNPDLTFKSLELTKLLPTQFNLSNPDLDLHLELLSSTAHFQWYKPNLPSVKDKSSYTPSPLLNLICLKLKEPKIAKLRDLVVDGWVKDSALFRHNFDEFKLWKAVVQNLNLNDNSGLKVMELIDLAITKLFKQPYHYTDLIKEQLESNQLNSSNLPSPLLASLSEVVLKDSQSQSTGLDFLICVVKLMYLKYSFYTNFSSLPSVFKSLSKNGVNSDNQYKLENLFKFMDLKTNIEVGELANELTADQWETDFNDNLTKRSWFLSLLQLLETQPHIFHRVQQTLRENTVEIIASGTDFIDQSLLSWLEKDSERTVNLVHLLQPLPELLALLTIPGNLLQHPTLVYFLGSIVKTSRLAVEIIIYRLNTFIFTTNADTENNDGSNDDDLLKINHSFDLLEKYLMLYTDLIATNLSIWNYVASAIYSKFLGLSRFKQFRVIQLFHNLKVGSNCYVTPTKLLDLIYPTDTHNDTHTTVDYSLLVPAINLLTVKQVKQLFDHLLESKCLPINLRVPLLTRAFLHLIDNNDQIELNNQFNNMLKVWSTQFLIQPSLYLNYLNSILKCGAQQQFKIKDIQALERLGNSVFTKLIKGKKELDSATLNFIINILPIHANFWKLFDKVAIQSLMTTLERVDGLASTLQFIDNLPSQHTVEFTEFTITALKQLMLSLVDKLVVPDQIKQAESAIRKLVTTVGEVELDLMSKPVQLRPTFLATVFNIPVSKLGYSFNLVSKSFNSGSEAEEIWRRDGLCNYLDYCIQQFELDNLIDTKFAYFKDLVTSLIAAVDRKEMDEKILKKLNDLIVTLDFTIYKQVLEGRLKEFIDIAMDLSQTQEIVTAWLVPTITAILHKDLDYFAVTEHLPNLITIYRGTLSSDDQSLLKLFYTVEAKLNKPIKLQLLGCINKSIGGKDGNDKLNSQLLTGELVRNVLTSFKSEYINNALQLNLVDFEFENFAAVTDNSSISYFNLLNDPTTTYDPKFILPLLTNLIQIATPNDSIHFIQSYTLQFLVLLLSNKCPTIRLKVAGLMEDFLQLVQKDATNNNLKKLTLTVLYGFKHSIKVNEKDLPHQFPQVSYLLTRFTANATTILENPSHPCFLTMLNTLLHKVSLDSNLTYNLEFVDNPFHTNNLDLCKATLQYLTLALDDSDSFNKLQEEGSLDSMYQLLCYEARLEHYLKLMVCKVTKHEGGLLWLIKKEFLAVAQLKLNNLIKNSRNWNQGLVEWGSIINVLTVALLRFNLHSQFKDSLLTLNNIYVPLLLHQQHPTADRKLVECVRLLLQSTTQLFKGDEQVDNPTKVQLKWLIENANKFLGKTKENTKIVESGEEANQRGSCDEELEQVEAALNSLKQLV